MAAALVVPAQSRTNRPVAISGTEFEADTAVTISIGGRDSLSVQVLADENGDFDASTVVTWAPSDPGRYTIKADDGTNVVTADVVVSTTT